MNELIKLIDTNPEEAKIQKFFEKHPASIIGAAYALSNTLIAKLPLGVDFVTDFTWVNPRSGPTYVYLIEIEKPSKLIFNQDGSFTKNFNHAYGQVEDWLGWCARNQSTLRDTLAPLKSHDDLPPFFAVRGILIYGRDSELNNKRREERWIQKGLSNPFIEVRTYDGWARERNNNIPPHDNLANYLSTAHYSNRSYINKNLPNGNV
ncbi:Shedu immune nuclease family protein [Yersinia enterocolitica]|uniref:Shedu immune nuclease family protein n=1 Tax=Yersinia enterocolitica TaxID=630 RepID=UPI00036F2043|nr:Shedu immune nuclease family protein [Yersinia enterocolitica]